MKKALPVIVVILMLILGLGILLYPDISSWYNARIQSGLTQTYNEDVARMAEEAIAEHFRRAQEYNDALSGGHIQDPFVQGSGAVLPPAYYMETLNVGGIMAQIEIPRLNIDLPVFHTTCMRVLDRGVGHIEGTSFPIGGQGTHAVLTGHSGLAHARMFTSLLESHGGIVIGDVFFIHVLDRTLAYQVDQIITVTPDNIETLRIAQNADYVTLVTCTPYAINSHRLLVRGARIPFTPELEEEIEASIPRTIDFRLLIVIGFVLLFLLVLLFLKIKDRKKEKAEERAILRRLEESLERLRRSRER